MAKILVTGIGGPAGKSVTTLLLEAKHQVIGTDSRVIYWDGITFYQVPEANHSNFCNYLYQIAQTEKVDLIISTVSEELPILASPRLASHRAYFAKYPVVIASPTTVFIANDKYFTFKHLSKRGIATPRSLLTSQAVSPDEIGFKIGWPCLSKPRISRGGRKVKIYCESKWPEVKSLDEQYLLQEFIPGIEYCPNLYRAQNGETTVVVLEKTALKEVVIGNALKVKRVQAPDVANLAVAAAKALDLTGPADIDIRRRSDGTPAILEINARFGAHIMEAPEVFSSLLGDFQLK
ncbi:MAG TPA: ATP-grasp domain-containing protein [Bacillota bacterium]|nr:ATP-grasp domain-containing protein [Bacillota bacterium]